MYMVRRAILVTYIVTSHLSLARNKKKSQNCWMNRSRKEEHT